MSAVAADKPSLRRHFLALRASLPPAERVQGEAVANAALMSLLPEVRALLAYRALGAELRLGPLLEAAERRGLPLACPSHGDDPAALAAALPGGAGGPPCLVLAPGVAFSAGGGRLGRGSGFYDRLLSLLPADTVRIGVAFEAQLAPVLPTEGHDAPMHALATGGGLRLTGACPAATAAWLRAYCHRPA